MNFVYSFGLGFSFLCGIMAGLAIFSLCTRSTDLADVAQQNAERDERIYEQLVRRGDYAADLCRTMESIQRILEKGG